MKTIHKFELGKRHNWTTRPILIKLPEYANFLRFGFQGDTACAWFDLYDDSPRIEREFYLVPTGGEVPIAQYKGTAISSDGGTLVLHLYERKK